MKHRILRVCLHTVLACGVFAAISYGSSDIDMLSWTWYKGEYDTYYVIGEVENTGDASAEFVMLVATLYDSSGNIAGTDFTYTYLDIVAPGERSPFKLALWDLPEMPHRCRLQWEWRETRQRPGRLVIVSNIRGYYDTDYEAFRVVGELENKSGGVVEFVMIALTCYDEDGEVVSCDFTYSTLDTIPAGGTSPFETWISDWATLVKEFRWIVQYSEK